ncbi:MAG: hypothetical protein JWO38_3496 [Gemmataceae bacterium]|nr:hypothetical protein [Gemmataceae bacterium]
MPIRLHRFLRAKANPSLATIILKKTDAGVSWGSVHWQYLKDLAKVSPPDGGPMKVEWCLFKRSFTKVGPVIDAFEGDLLAVGNEFVGRVALRTDRDLEYVHLKDHPGSGTEPVNVLSRYRFQDGLAYNESTKDTATHVFIDYLPKGNYVFECAVGVQHRASTRPGSRGSSLCTPWSSTATPRTSTSTSSDWPRAVLPLRVARALRGSVRRPEVRRPSCPDVCAAAEALSPVGRLRRGAAERIR